MWPDPATRRHGDRTRLKTARVRALMLFLGSSARWRSAAKKCVWYLGNRAAATPLHAVMPMLAIRHWGRAAAERDAWTLSRGGNRMNA